MFACYTRVSTYHQKNDAQKLEIQNWLDNHNIKNNDIIWYEDKESGNTLNRPAFSRMQSDIFLGKIKTIIVWKLDRISRRQLEGINLLADWCDKGLRIIVITQQIDLSGTIGRMIASILFGLAEIENQYRKERQTAGIASAKLRGIYKGRKIGSTKANPTRAIKLRSQGLKIHEIASSLKVSIRTIHRYLKMPSD